MTQGLAVATGLQNRFDWAGVAAAGVGAGVTSALGVNPVSGGNRSVGAYLSNVGASMASDIANAATRSLVQGSDFGDNIIAALPDTIAQTIGNVIANGVSESSILPPDLDSPVPVSLTAEPVDHVDGPDLATIVDQLPQLADQSDDQAALDKPNVRGGRGSTPIGSRGADHVATAADLAIATTPGSAPNFITFSSSLQKSFDARWAASFPGGHSQEQGEDVVNLEDGTLDFENVGGLRQTSGNFEPNLILKDARDYGLLGVMHTHPYDKTEGSLTGMSIDGGDAGYLMDHQINFVIAQSGSQQFLMLKTWKSPTNINATSLQQQSVKSISELNSKGFSYPQASRIVAAAIAKAYNLAYYEGSNGRFARVYP